MSLSHARLVEALELDAENGVLIWRIGKRRGHSAGQVYIRNKRTALPYWTINFAGRTYKRANLIWFYTHRRWPRKGKEVDHHNRDSLDDRPVNLRLATRAQNNANRSVFKNNKCGCKGVHFIARKKKPRWRAMISIGGKNKSLGHFDSLEAAKFSYEQAARKVYGDFLYVA